MLSVILYSFTTICLLTACVSAYMETVVGVVGRKVTLPCSSEAVSKKGVEVCWGRGEPSLFTCHNTLVATDGTQVTHRTSYRYTVKFPRVSDDVSLSIYNARQSDSGFYHCRIQLPGLFNDQAYTVHLIITNARGVTDLPLLVNTQPLHTAEEARVVSEKTHTSISYTGSIGERGTDITGDYTVGPMVAPVKTLQEQPNVQLNRLKDFIGNTIRLALIIFIPAVMLIAGYSVWSKQRAETCRRLPHSDQEESSV